MADLVYYNWYQSSPVLGDHSPARFRAPASHAIDGDQARLAFLAERLMKIIDEFAEKMIESQEQLLAKFQQRSEKFQIPSKTTGTEQTRSSEKEEFPIDVCGGQVLEKEGVKVKGEPRKKEGNPVGGRKRRSGEQKTKKEGVPYLQKNQEGRKKEVNLVEEKERRFGEQKTKKEEVPNLKKLTGRRMGGSGDFADGFVGSGGGSGDFVGGGGGSGDFSGGFAGSGGAAGLTREDGGDARIEGDCEDLKKMRMMEEGRWSCDGSGGGPGSGRRNYLGGGVAGKWWGAGGDAGERNPVGVVAFWELLKHTSFTEKLFLEATRGMSVIDHKKKKFMSLHDVDNSSRILRQGAHSFYHIFLAHGQQYIWPIRWGQKVRPDFNFILNFYYKTPCLFRPLLLRLGPNLKILKIQPIFPNNSFSSRFILHHPLLYWPTLHFIEETKVVEISFQHLSTCFNIFSKFIILQISKSHNLPNKTCLYYDLRNFQQPTTINSIHNQVTRGRIPTHLEDKVEVWAAGSGNYGGVDRVVIGVAGVRDPMGTPSDYEGGWKDIGHEGGGYGGCRLEFGRFARTIFVHRSCSLCLTTVMGNLWAAGGESVNLKLDLGPTENFICTLVVVSDSNCCILRAIMTLLILQIFNSSEKLQQYKKVYGKGGGKSKAQLSLSMEVQEKSHLMEVKSATDTATILHTPCILHSVLPTLLRT